MKKIFNTFAVFIALVVGVVSISAQPKPSVVTGDVVSTDSSKIVIKTKDGDLDVVLSGTTEFKRVPPENPVLKAAVAAAITDVSVGDKLMVTGVFGDDKKSLPARAVYIMSKSDIAQKQAKENERWATRGITGRVTAVNTSASQVTIEVRGMMNSTSVVVSPKSEIIYKRYAPNSVRYDEAKESSIADIKVGDMLRAVGDRGADNTTFTAEEVLTGAFQTVAGTVKSIDAEKGEIVVTDMATEKDSIVKVTTSSQLKRFPEDMATRMAGFGGGGAAPGGQGGIRPAGGGRPGGQPGAGDQPGQGGQPGPGGMRMGGGAGRNGIDDMFERLPAIGVSDLKIGDVIAVSSSKGNDASSVTAIKLVAGVEPFVKAAQTQTAAGRGGRNSGGGVSFSIPGLDGFDNN